jgi:DNA-3-methyladenine glycosylase I
MKTLKRCRWVTEDPLYITYHDKEWGVPVHNDQKLFEFLTLEGAQAGLSWLTVLKKRENYRAAFDNYDIAKIARYTPAKITKLLQNEGIIRNRLKVASTVGNAKAALSVQKEWGSLSKYIWHFVDGTPLQNKRRNLGEVPARTEISDKMSKDLKKRGFKFIGTTICYAFMQAVGMVNDHTNDCFCQERAAAKKSRKKELA